MLYLTLAVLVFALALLSIRHLQTSSSSVFGRVFPQQREHFKPETSDQKLRKVLSRLKDVVFEINQAGAYTYLNDAWTRLTGHDKNESIGTLLLSILVEGDHDKHAPTLDALLQNKTQNVSFEARIRTYTNETRWVKIDIQAFADETSGLPSYIGTITDNTDRHEAELAIELRNRAIQAASNGILIADLTQHDTPIIFANKAVESITGYTTSELIGRNCRLLQGEETSPTEALRLRQAIKSGEPCKATLKNYRKDGSLFWNDLSISPVVNPDSGQVTHYIGVQTDITSQKQSETLLVEWLARLDVIFTLSPDPLVFFDDDQLLNYANPAAERVFNAPMGALSGMNLARFYDHIRALGSSKIELPEPDGTSTQQETRYTREYLTGEKLIRLTRPQSCTLKQSYRYCGERGRALVIYFQDITREAELDRMKSDFLSTAAHELRTPMASIMGFSELLLMRKFDENQTRELLTTINKQSLRLTNLLNDLLDIARIEARQSEVFDYQLHSLPALLEEALNAFLIPDEARPIIKNFGAAPPACIRVDKQKFQQCVLNLLSNAYKFSPEGGDIEISIVTAAQLGENQVGVCVRDQGIGMNAEETSRVFERFYRTDRSGHIPGTGLGLSLVKDIMQLHGGSVNIQSAPNAGTAVTLWFPLSPMPAE